MAMDSNNCSALVKGGESPKKSKAGLLKDSTSRIGRVLKQNKIKDADYAQFNSKELSKFDS